MSTPRRKEESECTCHCGGSMFYRHLHAPSCPLSVTGEEAPESEVTRLRAEVERLTQERDEAVKRNNEDSAILALSGNQVAWFAGKLADIERKYLAIQREQKAQDVKLDAVRYRAEQAEQELAASQARVRELETIAEQTDLLSQQHSDEFQAVKQQRDRLRTALEACVPVLDLYVLGGNPRSPYQDGQCPIYVLGSRETLELARRTLEEVGG